MLVKCKCCGMKNEREMMYKVVVNTKNEYYCNEEEYKVIVRNKKYKDNTYQIINNVFGYKVINTMLFKELKSIVDMAGYEKLYKYLLENEKRLTQIMTKQFNNEIGRIRYFSAIIKNSIGDYIETESNVTNVTYNIDDVEQVRYKKKERRKCIMDYLKDGE